MGGRRLIKKENLIPPLASSPQVSAVMRGNKSNDTSPELVLRSALWKSNIRGYRKHVRNLPGCPDLVFPRIKIAVFVHGCFWHLCPKCNIAIPKTNMEYWKEKLLRNVERDKRVFKQLQQSGWKVMRIWECDIHKSVDKCVSQIYQENKKIANVQ